MYYIILFISLSQNQNQVQRVFGGQYKSPVDQINIEEILTKFLT